MSLLFSNIGFGLDATDAGRLGAGGAFLFFSEAIFVFSHTSDTTGCPLAPHALLSTSHAAI